MAITTLSGALAGMQVPQWFAKGPIAGTGTAGKPYTFWGASGIPGPGSYDTTLNGVTLSSTGGVPAGAIPHNDPASGLAYLARFQANSNINGFLMLCDRIWHNGGISASSASAQLITSPAWPARDANGATSGVSILLALEVSATMGAGTPTISISYTNTAGTAGRTGTHIDVPVTAAITGSMYRIGLQATDTGVQSVQSLTFGGTPWASGTCNLVAYRVLATLELTSNGTTNEIDALSGGMPQVFNGTVPFIVLHEATGIASAVATGQYIETQG